MNERMEGKWFSVYLSSVIHGTINYPLCQSVVYLFSQMVSHFLEYFYINNLHCTFIFSGNLCVLGGKKITFYGVTEHQIIMCFIMNVFKNLIINYEIETPLKYKYLKCLRQII